MDCTLNQYFPLDATKNAISSDKLVIFKKADKQISEEIGIQTSNFWWQNKEIVSPMYEEYSGWVLGWKCLGR